MTDRNIKQILDTLDYIQEKLLALPDDMLLQIDPRDNESLKEGYEFITAYNEDLNKFSCSTSRLKKKIEHHFSIKSETEEIETDKDSKVSRERIIEELDKTEPHSLEENFTYKRPYGFVFGEVAVKGVKTWKTLYMNILSELSKKDTEKLNNLPRAEQFITKRGHLLFSNNEEKLRIGEKLPGTNLFIEINLSANHIIKNIINLFEYFEVSADSMKIYLREDRDAELF